MVKIIVGDFCFVKHFISNWVTDGFIDEKKFKVCQTKIIYRDHFVGISIDEDGTSSTKKTVCNFISDLFSYYR
jgi:hypothetical protein